MALEGFEDRQLRSHVLDVFFGFLDAGADPQTDEDENGIEEGDGPPPGEEGLGGEAAAEQAGRAPAHRLVSLLRFARGGRRLCLRQIALVPHRALGRRWGCRRRTRAATSAQKTKLRPGGGRGRR